MDIEEIRKLINEKDYIENEYAEKILKENEEILLDNFCYSDGSVLVELLKHIKNKEYIKTIIRKMLLIEDGKLDFILRSIYEEEVIEYNGTEYYMQLNKQAIIKAIQSMGKSSELVKECLEEFTYEKVYEYEEENYGFEKILYGFEEEHDENEEKYEYKDLLSVYNDELIYDMWRDSIDEDFIEEFQEKYIDKMDTDNVIYHLLSDCEDKEFVKKFIKKYEHYYPYAKAVNDPEFIEECIFNESKTDWGLNKNNRTIINEKLSLIEEKNIKVKYILIKKNKLIREKEGKFFNSIIDNKITLIKTKEELEKIQEDCIIYDIEAMEKSLKGFTVRDFFNCETLNQINKFKKLSENLYKNKFSIPFIYGKNLIDEGIEEDFYKKTDFRIFNGEFPKINDLLSEELEEERLNFFKFANAIGCFSKERILNKNGEETEALLAQKSSSFLAQLVNKNILGIGKYYDLFETLPINCKPNQEFMKFISERNKGEFVNLKLILSLEDKFPRNIR